MQACGFCNLIKENGVSQEYVNRNFKEIHWNVSDKSIWANQCLPWLMLSMDDRIKVVKASNVFCRICLRLMGMGATTNSCGAGNTSQAMGRIQAALYLTVRPMSLCAKNMKRLMLKITYYTKQHLDGKRESPQDSSRMMMRKTIHT